MERSWKREMENRERPGGNWKDTQGEWIVCIARVQTIVCGCRTQRHAVASVARQRSAL